MIDQKLMQLIATDLIAECERAMKERDQFLKTGVVTAGHGGSNDTCFLAILKKHLAMTAWQPIETAPKDNVYPLLLARFNDDGTLQSFDYDGSWERDRESWEIPQEYYYWASAHGNVEEPSHWMYQPEWFARVNKV